MTGLNGVIGGSENRRLSGAGTAPVEKHKEYINSVATQNILEKNTELSCKPQFSEHLVSHSIK